MRSTRASQRKREAIISNQPDNRPQLASNVPDPVRQVKDSVIAQFWRPVERWKDEVDRQFLRFARNITGVGAGWKIIDGKPNPNHWVIRVFVNRKFPSDLPDAMRLPPDSEGIPIEVIETGRFHPLAGSDPLRSGSTISIKDSGVDRSLGAFLKDKNSGKRYLLTCAHVLHAATGAEVTHLDSNDAPLGTVATLTSASQFKLGHQRIHPTRQIVRSRSSIPPLRRTSQCLRVCRNSRAQPLRSLPTPFYRFAPPRPVALFSLLIRRWKWPSTSAPTSFASSYCSKPRTAGQSLRYPEIPAHWLSGRGQRGMTPWD
jgi:hypothetical protein